MIFKLTSNINSNHYTTSQAKEKSIASIECWGSVNPLREFKYLDDLSKAITFILESWVPRKSKLYFLILDLVKNLLLKNLLNWYQIK